MDILVFIKHLPIINSVWSIAEKCWGHLSSTKYVDRNYPDGDTKLVQLKQEGYDLSWIPEQRVPTCIEQQGYEIVTIWKCLKSVTYKTKGSTGDEVLLKRKNKPDPRLRVGDR